MTSRIERRQSALWVILDRPHTGNAITDHEIGLLESAATLAVDDEEIAAIVITGSGRTFSGGVDLRTAATATPEHLSTLLTRLQAAYRALELCPRPVIATVNDPAIAGGFELVLCCDLVVAADTATFGDGHAAVGLVPGGGATFRLPRRIGPNRARELLYPGRAVGASEMERYGLVNTVVPVGDLDDAAGRLVRSIPVHSRLTTGRVKLLVEDGRALPTDEAISAELATAIDHRSTADATERLSAFLEPRLPVLTPPDSHSTTTGDR